VASAQEGSYRLDPATALKMPTLVTIHSPAAQLTMQINLGIVEINRPNSTAPAYWTPPTYADTPTVDLCDPRLQLGQPLAGR